MGDHFQRENRAETKKKSQRQRYEQPTLQHHHGLATVLRTRRGASATTIRLRDGLARLLALRGLLRPRFVRPRRGLCAMRRQKTSHQQRRARNREAAARQRNRRLAKVDLLEGEVAVLTESNCSLQSENKRLRAELDQLRFKMKVSPTPTKKSVKRPAPVEIKPIVADIPDQLFTPGGNFVLQTPAELKGQNFFPMETSKPDEELIKKEKQFMRQDSFSEYLNLL